MAWVVVPRIVSCATTESPLPVSKRLLLTVLGEVIVGRSKLNLEVLFRHRVHLLELLRLRGRRMRSHPCVKSCWVCPHSLPMLQLVVSQQHLHAQGLAWRLVVRLLLLKIVLRRGECLGLGLAMADAVLQHLHARALQHSLNIEPVGLAAGLVLHLLRLLREGQHSFGLL